MRGNRWLIWALVAGGLIIALLLVIGQLSAALDDEDARLRLTYLLILLAAMGGGVFYRLRYDTSRTLGQVAIWVVIFAGLVLAYSFRSEFSALAARFGDELTPMAGRVEGPGMISFPVTENGHYQVRARVDGSEVTFAIDTGASSVVLSPQAAERLGYDLEQLEFNGAAQTANGLVRTASIEIEEFVLGPIVIHNLPATVNEADMSTSLLGMEFLRRLKSWRVEGERITLEQ